MYLNRMALPFKMRYPSFKKNPVEAQKFKTGRDNRNQLV